MTSLAGLSGGASPTPPDRGGNNSGSTSAAKGKKQQKEKTEIPIFKYSRRFKDPLHEAIILGTEPFFLNWNNEKREPELFRVIEEKSRILRPPAEEYPYEPIEFSSLTEIKEYMEMARHETIETLLYPRSY